MLACVGNDVSWGNEKKNEMNKGGMGASERGGGGSKHKVVHMQTHKRTRAYLAVGDVKRLIEGGLDHLHHLGVIKVVHNVLEDGAIVLKAEGAEDRNHRHILPHIRQRRMQHLQTNPTNPNKNCCACV